MSNNKIDDIESEEDFNYEEITGEQWKSYPPEDDDEKNSLSVDNAQIKY